MLPYAPEAAPDAALDVAPTTVPAIAAAPDAAGLNIYTVINCIPDNNNIIKEKNIITLP